MLLRLLDHGFALVADDRVVVVDGVASAPAALAGLLEVRGLGIVRFPFIRQAGLALVVQLRAGPRLPAPQTDAPTGLPLVMIDPACCSAPARVALALDCALDPTRQVAGAFA